MAKFRVRVVQWVEEIADKVFEAENEQDARDKAEDFNGESGDWNWSDGNDINGFDIVSVKELK